MGKIIKYWYGVKIAVVEHMDERGDPLTRLKNGFWPITHQEATIDCRFICNRDAREKFDQNESLTKMNIGEVQFQLNPSF